MINSVIIKVFYNARRYKKIASILKFYVGTLTIILRIRSLNCE